MTRNLAQIFIGSTARMRRVMAYWAATAFIYSLCAAVVLREGSLEQPGRPGAWGESSLVAGIGFAAVSLFYIVLRSSEGKRIAQWRLALGQAYFAVLYDMLLYAVLGDLRGAILIGLPVVIVFCAFALRPAQTIALSAFAIAALAVTCSLLAWLRPAQHPWNIEIMHVILASFGVASVAAINSELSRLRARLIDAVATIRRLATTDELTHLANRRHMHELLDAEQQRRHAAPGHVCIALLDIDHFKHINDRHGHAAGDAVLQAFAGAAQDALRSGDTLARWGGEEFLLLMPDTELPDAMAALARIDAAVAALRFAAIDPQLRLTFSAGAAAATLPGARFDEAIARADAAMYQAKAAGRNRVVAAPASA